MAIQKSVMVELRIWGDGTTTSFDVDLGRDPYYTENGLGQIHNWFSDDPKTSSPSSVEAGTGGTTVSLLGSVVTIAFSTAPISGPSTVNFYVIFS